VISTSSVITALIIAFSNILRIGRETTSDCGTGILVAERVFTSEKLPKITALPLLASR